MKWRHSKEYKHWRASAIAKNPLCLVCAKTQDLHVHHVEHAHYNKSLRYSASNAVTMCRQCHSKFHTDFKRSYRQRCDRQDLENFVSLSKYFKSLCLSQADGRVTE